MTICIKHKEKTKGKVFTDASSASAYMLGRNFNSYNIWKIVNGKKVIVPFVSADVFVFEAQLNNI